MFVYFRFERVIGWLSSSCGRCFGAKWENTCPHHFMLFPVSSFGHDFIIHFLHHKSQYHSFVGRGGIKGEKEGYYLYIIYIIYK